MSEWLDLMLEEIARKRRELHEAEDELKRRKDASQRQIAGGRIRSVEVAHKFLRNIVC